ncbi:MAG: Trk system potassium transporter TrkA [Endozoicomonadaceae bacterium]|nr:Trk system potassium transporter TrkA [Endozoicomonadaceae bacterium]
MNIIILGAGHVGTSLINYLTCQEKNDITVIDNNVNRLNELNQHLDIKTIEGNGCYPDILEQANANNTDLLLAVTNSDEINMLACEFAHTLFRIPKKIARIKYINYLNRPEIFNNLIHIDVFIKPEKLVKNHLKNLIEFPSTVRVADFKINEMQIFSVRAKTRIDLAEQLHEFHSQTKKRLVAVFHNKKAIPVNDETVIQEDDEILLMAERQQIKPILKSFGYTDKFANKHIVIAGGGNIGFHLAKSIKLKHNVKIIEKDNDRCKYLSQNLDNVVVFYGDTTDKNLLTASTVHSADIYIALTDNDSTNITSSLLAKKLGAKKVITLINNIDIANLPFTTEIDCIVTPQMIMINYLLYYIERKEAINICYTTHDMHIAEVSGTSYKTLHKKNERYKDIKILAVIRDDQIIFVDNEFAIDPKDRIFILCKNIIKKDQVSSL